VFVSLFQKKVSSFDINSCDSRTKRVGGCGGGVSIDTHPLVWLFNKSGAAAVSIRMQLAVISEFLHTTKIDVALNWCHVFLFATSKVIIAIKILFALET